MLVIIVILVALVGILSSLKYAAHESTTQQVIVATYDNPIQYTAPNPNEQQQIGTCGIYSRLFVPMPPSNPSDYANYTAPIGTVVYAVFYGILNGTRSCPVLNSLTLNVYQGFPHDWNYVSTVRLNMVRTSNTTVYGASITFTSDYGDNDVNMTLTQLPNYVRDLSFVAFHFNMGPSYHFSTTIQYPNETVYTVEAPPPST